MSALEQVARFQAKQAAQKAPSAAVASPNSYPSALEQVAKYLAKAKSAKQNPPATKATTSSAVGSSVVVVPRVCCNSFQSHYLE